MRKCANLCVSETRFLERDIFRRHFVSTADERAMDVVVDNVAVLASAREDVIVPCKRPLESTLRRTVRVRNPSILVKRWPPQANTHDASCRTDTF